MDNAPDNLYQKPVEMPANFDWVVRVKCSDDSKSSPYISFMEKTPRFVEKYRRPFFEKEVLSYALKNLWLTHRYNQEYISFLLKTCSKEKFLSKAREYARSFQEITHDQLAFGANLLLRTFDQPLTSAELSLLLNVDPAIIDSSNLPLIEFSPELTEPGENV